MPFEVLDLVSTPADELNEDVVGYSRHVFWLMDGASVGTRQVDFPHDASALQWLLAAYNTYFSEHGDRFPYPSDLALAAIRAVSKEWSDAVHVGTVSESDLRFAPSATLLLGRVVGETLRIVSLGDIAFMHWRGEEFLKNLSDLSALEREHERLRKAGFDESAFWTLTEESRSQMGEESGARVLSFDERAIDGALKISLEAEAGDLILLATDGLCRLWDVYEGSDDLLRLVNGEATLLQLVTKLRALERHRRPEGVLKRHDDATGLLLRVAL